MSDIELGDRYSSIVPSCYLATHETYLGLVNSLGNSISLCLYVSAHYTQITYVNLT